MNKVEDDFFENELRISTKIKELYVHSWKMSLEKVLMDLKELELICLMNKSNLNLFKHELVKLLEKKEKLERKLQNEKSY